MQSNILHVDQKIELNTRCWKKFDFGRERLHDVIFWAVLEGLKDLKVFEGFGYSLLRGVSLFWVSSCPENTEILEIRGMGLKRLNKNY